MRLVKLGFGAAFAIAAQGSLAAEGRWEGVARLPGGPVPVVIDLAPRGSAWVGAATLPGRGLAGARLRTIEVGADGSVRAALPAAAGAPPESAASVELRRSSDARALEGHWRQGGHSAPLVLARSGAAQLAAPPAPTPLAPALAGTWRGRYDIGFGAREVTLRLAPPAAASMTIVGQRTTEITFDDVVQHGAFVVLSAHEAGITIEAPWADAARGTLAAVWMQGPFEAALALRREAARGGAMNLRATIALLLAACMFTVQAQTMFRGDAARRGTTSEAAPRTLAGVKWSFQTGERIVSSPVAHAGTVYFGSDDGQVYALDAASGRLRWAWRTGGPVPSTPAVHDGRVFVASYDGRLHALDAASGAPLWKFASEGERRFEARGLHGAQPRTQTLADPYDVYLSSPAVAQGLVVFGSGDGHVYALDAASGALRWKFRSGDVVHASPAVADGMVFVGSWDGRFYALDLVTGVERWRFQAGVDALMHNQQGFQASAAVVDGVVYVGCRDSHLYALDAKTGAERWRFSTGQSWVVSSPAVADGKVVFATSDSSRVHIVNAADGKPLVQQEDKAYMFSSPTIAGNGVFLIGVLNGTLVARDLADGRVLWTFRTEASSANAGWVLGADGRLNTPWIFTSNWRESMALGFARQTSVGSIFSTPLVMGGVVYVGSADGRLYALH